MGIRAYGLDTARHGSTRGLGGCEGGGPFFACVDANPSKWLVVLKVMAALLECTGAPSQWQIITPFKIINSMITIGHPGAARGRHDADK